MRICLAGKQIQVPLPGEVEGVAVAASNRPALQFEAVAAVWTGKHWQRDRKRLGITGLPLTLVTVCHRVRPSAVLAARR
jgi:hypothetical protein